MLIWMVAKLDNTRGTLFQPHRSRTVRHARPSPQHQENEKPDGVKTRCMSYGRNHGAERILCIRWDFVLYLYIQLSKKGEPLDIPLSSLIVADRQDPSMVGDVSCCYQVFLNNGFTATGMYLKSTQFLSEAFFDKALWPEERVWKLSWVKTFLVKWSEVASGPNFISTETFKDVKCCCDGLILYILVLAKYFKDQVLVPWFLTSDVCEQAFAFVRVGRYNGRRTNVDASTLAEGLECLNRASELKIYLLW